MLFPLLKHLSWAHPYYFILETNLNHHHRSHQRTHHHIHPDFSNLILACQGNFLYPIAEFQGIHHFNFHLSCHPAHLTNF